MSEEKKEELKLRSNKKEKTSLFDNLKLDVKHIKNKMNKKKSSPTENSTDDKNSSKEKRKGKGKKKRTTKQTIWLIIKICLIFGFACCIAVGIYVWVTIHNAEKIDTSDISSLLSQSSYLYDDQGEIIDTTYASENRTIVELKNVPDHVQKAFIALEDRKFETHHGINIIRMIGAIKDSILGGGEISGTSTITQQLARNVFLTETMSVRSIQRKVTEIYYATVLEKNLTKDQILEGYLNTINFGLGYGIQTVAQTYFSKDVSELTIAEAAALATLPQAPSYYALVKRIDLEYVNANQDHLIYTDSSSGYIWNDKCKDRMHYCLATMLDLGYINQEEYDEAIKVEIKDIVNPNFEALYSTEVNYFADYVIEQVIYDLMSEYGYSYDDSYDMVYSGGLRIYTTLSSEAQASVDAQVSNRDAFPNIYPPYNAAGNITYNDSDDVLLYKYSNYIDENGVFTLRNDEYTKNADGSIRIKYKGRIAFYPVSYDDVEDVNLEFRNMYLWEDDEFFTINGGILNVPRKYKTLESNNDVTISKDFFIDMPDFFTDDGNGNLSTRNFSLRTKTIQPQVAVTIVDNATGAIKAMCGGRETSGRNLFNRAIAPHQPGSSIKALTVYGAAIQNSYELSKEGRYLPIYETGFDKQGTNLYGNYITCGSVFDDEPLIVDGREWPKNDESYFEGLVSFKHAIQQSINVVAVKIVAQLGVDYSFELAQKFGLTDLDNEYDRNLSSMALGGTYGGATTLQMASAISTYVNDGVLKSSYCYDKVTTRTGTLLLEPAKKETQVLDPGVAWIMRDVLQSVVSYGTPRAAAISGQGVGGKTGTTDLQESLWFNGFTANYTTSLWIGPDVRIQTDGWGGTTCAGMWRRIMQDIPAALGGSYSSRPDNVISVVVDNKTGFLPVDKLSKDTRTEYFIRGTEPTQALTLFTSVDICPVSGKLAGPNCDATKTQQLSGIQRPYIPNKRVLDFKNELPHEVCDKCGVESGAEYSVYVDENGLAVYASNGLRIMIRNSDKAYVTIKGSNETVFKQNPDGSLYLDSNKNPVPLIEKVTVPDLSDGTFTYDDALAELDAIGLTISYEETETDDINNDGIVYNQNIPAGTEIDKGSNVIVYVYKYVEPEEDEDGDGDGN